MLISALLTGLITAKIYYRRYQKHLPATAAVNAAIATIMLQATQDKPDHLQPMRIEQKDKQK